jgi:hypothetical protein
MEWDLGIAALLELAALSVLVGLLVELICGPGAPDWLWVRVSLVYFVVAAWITDAWFGWLTPGGLTIEDMLLVGLAPLPAVVLVTRSMYHADGRGSGKRGRPSHGHRRPPRHAL